MLELQITIYDEDGIWLWRFYPRNLCSTLILCSTLLYSDSYGCDIDNRIFSEIPYVAMAILVSCNLVLVDRILTFHPIPYTAFQIEKDSTEKGKSDHPIILEFLYEVYNMHLGT